MSAPTSADFSPQIYEKPVTTVKDDQKISEAEWTRMRRGDRFFAHLQYRSTDQLSKLINRLRKTETSLRCRGHINKAFRPAILSMAAELILRSRNTRPHKVAREYMRAAAGLYSEAFRY